MKRAALGLFIVVPLIALIGVAMLRPNLLPAWAQFPAAAHADDDDGGLRCNEHAVPEKYCTLCHEELKTKLPYCKEHGVPEDICTLCHPELKEKYKIDTCEHGLPKHFCPKCGTDTSVSVIDDGWCPEHNHPKESCPECEKREARLTSTVEEKEKGEAKEEPKDQPRALAIVKLKDPKLAESIGLKTTTVAKERHAHRLKANAEVAYNASRYAEVRPRVSGFTREVQVETGDEVKKGQVLAVIDSPEVGTAKAQYLAALPSVALAEATLKRTTALVKKDALPGKNQLEAETALNQAKADLMNAEQRLRNLGFGDEELSRIRESRDARTTLSILSPIDGTVVARKAVAGEAVEPSSRLFDVADTSVMWVWIDMNERDVSLIAKGQPVTFTISGSETPVFSGKVSWVGTEVNPQTRTTRVRAELRNENAKLRANQFGRAEIQVEDEHAALIVPKAAVQDFERARLVFIAENDGSFRPQRVSTRAVGRSDVLEVTWGLKPNDRIVTARSYLLKTELMRDALGAGCTDD